MIVFSEVLFRRSPVFITFFALFLLGGCATIVTPDSLKRPDVITCIQNPNQLETYEFKGLLKYKWVTRVQKGPYISEYEDADGTYYRAPSGGIYFFPEEWAKNPSTPFMPRIYDGGIWVPKDVKGSPHIYTYISTQDGIKKTMPEGATCNSASLVSRPESQGVSTVAFALGGALGGAVGGVTANSVSNGSGVSYGQAAGVGAAGGLIGGVVVAALINMDVGKIVHQPVSTDQQFIEALKELAKNMIPLSSLDTKPPQPAPAN